MARPRIPTPCLVVLVGASGSGKSTWAAARFAPDEVVSSDRLRAVVGRGEDDQEASADAFDLLGRIVDARCGRGLTTVVDSTGLHPGDRARWLDAAQGAGLPAFAVPFTTDRATCIERNAGRPRPVPVRVIDQQLRTYASTLDALAEEGFEVVDPDPELRPVPPAFVEPAGAGVPEPSEAAGLAFGLQIPDYGAVGDRTELRARLREVAEAAEAVGFESLWVMDHLVQIPFVGRPWLDMLESWTTLSYLAGVTDRIRLGTMVTGITYRNVAHLAKIVATLDVLSGGRAVAGLGAAWFADEHRAYGYDFPSDRERLDLLADAIGLLRAMWGPGTKPFEGEVLSLPETTCYPRPLQEHVPVLVGGGGERRTLRIVAELADACNLIGDLATVRHKIAVLHRHCTEVGRDPDEIRITTLGTVLVGDDPAHVHDLVERHRGRRAAPAYASAVNAAPVEDQIARFGAFAEEGVDLCVVSMPDVSVEAVERFGRVIDQM